jgi:predicted alpha/beta superfamily hydrolase
VIKTEIIPLIEKKYSTNGKRGISGHSQGGSYVGNLMFKANDIFEKFGVNSPSLKSWNNNDIKLTEKEYS